MNTMQQEFDAVVMHLYEQGKPAKNGKTCMYRADDGSSCAVGCRIPDDKYIQNMEGMNLGGLLRLYGKQLPLEIKKYKNMFFDLQNVHDCWFQHDDGSSSWVEMAYRLEVIARDHGLVYNPPVYNK